MLVTCITAAASAGHRRMSQDVRAETQDAGDKECGGMRAKNTLLKMTQTRSLCIIFLFVQNVLLKCTFFYEKFVSVDILRTCCRLR